MAKAKFKKDETVLQVKNIGGCSRAVWVVKEVEIFSCGMKQIIIKDYIGGEPWRGAKYMCFESFFKLNEMEAAEQLRIENEKYSKKIEQETAIRLAR